MLRKARTIDLNVKFKEYQILRSYFKVRNEIKANIYKNAVSKHANKEWMHFSVWSSDKNKKRTTCLRKRNLSNFLERENFCSLIIVSHDDFLFITWLNAQKRCLQMCCQRYHIFINECQTIFVSTNIKSKYLDQKVISA